MMMTMAYHDPVLLFESVDGLNVKPDGTYVDVTFGGGGHSREILGRLNEKGRLYAFDQDADARRNVPEDERFTLIPQNFRHLGKFLRFYGARSVDGILADLGVSSHQFDSSERGFSTRFDSALDMRMDQDAEITALHVVNEYAEQKLAKLLYEYGELRNSRALANEIARARREKPIRTSYELREVLARVYQALRIEVNREMESLQEMLVQTSACMKRGGRLVVITYHSIEDRIVKNYMRSGNLEGKIEKDFYGNIQSPWRLVNRSVITPSEEEIKKNNRARSAKLRIAERTEN